MAQLQSHHRQDVAGCGSKVMRIVIVVPIYKPELSADEQTSLRHLEHHLHAFTKVSIQPIGLELCLPSFELREFPTHHFDSVTTYSKLLLSPEFYEAFTEYDYMLMYQLDCLVFSDKLQSWCEMEYDYVGAPLFLKNSQQPHISRVGNGGLSLRRVQSFLDVLHSSHVPSWGAVLSDRLPDLKKLPYPARWLKKLRVIRDARRGVKWYTANYGLNEDLFWSDRARLFNPSFKIAPLDVALRFAFDAHPRLCFAQNDCQLPFGAHAWTRWDRAFW